MFTGLVEAVGKIEKLSPRGPGVQLELSAPASLVAELTLGESVSVDGACLTVVRWGGGRFVVDASAETMKRTTLGERRLGDRCHLERALRLGERLGLSEVAEHAWLTTAAPRAAARSEAVGGSGAAALAPATCEGVVVMRVGGT